MAHGRDEGRRSRGRRTALLLAGATAVGGLGLQVAPAGAAEPSSRVIVVLEDDRMSAAGVRTAADELTDEHDGVRRHTYSSVFRGFSATVPADEVADLRRDPDVAAVYADVPIRASGEVPPGVQRVRADTVPGSRIGTGTAVDADVAVLDSGVNAHADLNLAGGVNCASDAGCAATAFADNHGHGTHVAGTAAAKDNGVGVVGTAPGARVWGVKVLGDTGGGSMSWFIAGLDWVVRKGGIEVVNASLGGPGAAGGPESQAIARATAAGVVVVVAAGNSNVDAAGTSPANAPDAITVSAYADSDGGAGGAGPATCGTADDTRATFSNFGAVVDVAAPGVCITSTGRAGGYVTMSGTSMASPHVAGAAATYVAQHGLAATGDRARLVREAFRGAWAAGQASACGFGGGRSAEPVLVMGGCPAGGDTVPPAGVPLTARPDAGTVQLTWPAATDASGIAAYRVYRATGATGAFALRTTLPGTATGHLDTGLVNGTVYRYSVAAVDGAGNAGGSAVVSAVPRDLTPPAAPALAGVGHDRSVTLTWPAVTDPSGIRGYQLWRALPGSAFVLRTTAASTARTFQDTGLVNGATYGYLLRAVDAAGNVSPSSGTVAVAPVDDRAPGLVVPTVVRGDGQLTLRWPAATDSSGIRSYTVSRSVGTTAPLQVLTTVGAGTLQLVDTGLVNGTAYRYSVAATDLNGLTTTGARVVTGLPADLTAPAPVDPTAVATDAAVRLSWPAATDVSGISSYRVYRATSTGAFAQVASVPGTTLAWSSTGLAAGTSYRYQLRAVDTKGNLSAPSAVVTATTPRTSVRLSPVRWVAGASTTATAPVTASFSLASETPLAVGGASVALRLVNASGAVVAGATTTSSTTGAVVLRASVARGTTYRLEVVAITVTGRTWDGVTPANAVTVG